MFDRLISIISKYSEVDASTITEDTVILRDLGFNSIAIIEMIGDVEDEFDIEIPDADLQDITTVGDLLKYLEENV